MPDDRCHLEFAVDRLGDCTIPSPLRRVRFVRDDESVLYHSSLAEIQPYLDVDRVPPCFEVAGPREMIHFEPHKVRAGIVTCGGICPGLNDVIRAIVLSLTHHYNVTRIFGFRYGYEGLTFRHRHRPVELTPDIVTNIHEQGGTILGSSRGPQNVGEMADFLEDVGISILFTVGGDGTLTGASVLAEEMKRRENDISIIAIPKTIDNDISMVQMSFGFDTAVSEARRAIYGAYTEAAGGRNGIGLVKLMGRESGFIAALSALANDVVDFCLVPEIPFTVEALLSALEDHLREKGHAVIVAAEGAGQDLPDGSEERDSSGNVRLKDIGLYIKEKVLACFSEKGIEVNLKYIDPGYIIRSVPANARDSAFCLLLGQNAVHAGMAGRTNMVVGFWRNEFTHVPISAAIARRKKIDPESWLWSAVLAATRQPELR